MVAESSTKLPQSGDPVRPCAVCGGQATGYHYEVLSCNGCKSFFRRTYVTNRTYVCRKGRACLLEKSLRRKCRACRYKKCIQAGMNPNTIVASFPLVHAGEEASSSCGSPETSGASTPAEQQSTSSSVVSREWSATTRVLVAELTLTEARVEDLRLSPDEIPPTILLDVLTRPSALSPTVPTLGRPDCKVSMDMEIFVLLEFAKTFKWFCHLTFSDKLTVLGQRLPAMMSLRLAWRGLTFLEEEFRNILIPLKDALIELNVDKAAISLLSANLLSESHDLHLTSSGQVILAKENKSYASCLAAYLFQKNSTTDQKVVEQHFLAYWLALNVAEPVTSYLRRTETEDSLCRQVVDYAGSI